MSGSHVGKLRALLAKASPPYTPADVREFGRRFLDLCPWAAKDGRTRPTLGEVEKYVGRLRAAPAAVTDGHPKATPASAATVDDLRATGLV